MRPDQLEALEFIMDDYDLPAILDTLTAMCRDRAARTPRWTWWNERADEITRLTARLSWRD
jgi:hypothetical protein